MSQIIKQRIDDLMKDVETMGENIIILYSETGEKMDHALIYGNSEILKSMVNTLQDIKMTLNTF